MNLKSSGCLFSFLKSNLCSEDSVKKSLWRHPFDRQHCFPTFPVTFNCFCYCCHSSVLFVIVVLFVLLFCLYREIGVFPKYEGESDSQDMKPYSCWYWHDIRYGYDTSWLHIATRQRTNIFQKGKDPTLIHSNFPLTNFIFGSEIAKYNWSKSISVTNIPTISEVYWPQNMKKTSY